MKCGDIIKKLISVIIPAHNEERTIEECLESVLNQKHFDRLIGEIIVVEDYSTDRTSEILRKYEDRVKIIRNKKNLGLSKSLNIGLKKTRFDFVCTLHADCILPKNWFEEQMKHFNKKVAVVTSKIILPTSIWDNFNFWNKIFFSKFLKPRKIICENKCDIYRKDILEKIGWLSKDFRVAGEDFDLYCKLKKRGYKVYSSDLLVKHIMSSHQRGFWNYLKKELQYGEARGVILRKHKFLILFNPFAFKIFKDWKLIFGLPVVIILRCLAHFIGFWKGLITGRQTW